MHLLVSADTRTAVSVSADTASFFHRCHISEYQSEEIAAAEIVSVLKAMNC